MDYDPFGNYIEDPSKENFGTNPTNNSNANLGRTTYQVESNRMITTGPVRPMPCMYGVFHMIISIFAIYLSFKCNGAFVLFDFLAALFCPFFYIIYRLAVSKNLCQ